MASPITFSGLATGLDTKAIVAALKAVEGRKVDQLRRNRDSFTQKIRAYDDLGTKLSKLETATKKLADADSFLAHKATLSKDGDSILSATPQGTALAGVYKIHVNSLAQSTFIRSAGQADPTSDLALTGTLSLQVGSTVTNITVNGTNSTLNGIRDAVNAAGADVTASVVFDGTDYHLELRGKSSGAANQVTVLAEPQPPPPLGPVLNLTQVRAATDASFTVDGQAFTSTTNTVENAIQGVTLQLFDQQAGGAADIQLTVAANSDTITQNLKDLVDAYNSVIDDLNDQSKARTDSSEAVKPLAGESSLYSIRSAFGGAISSVASVVSKYQSAASVGLTTDRNGRLELDSTKLGSALAGDLDGVKNLFTDATAGIGQRLLASVEKRTDSIDGTVKLRKDAFQSSISRLDKQISRASDALDQYEQGLVRKYAALETIVGKLQSQSNSLTSLSTQFGSSNNKN